MAVRFKGTSEYNEHYKPFQSYVVDAPKEQQSAPPAGVISEKIAAESEPPLQRKKRATGPATSLSSEFNDPNVQNPADDYILLGKNDKFVDNIRYRNRNNSNSKSIGDFNFNRDVSPPKIAKTKEYKENVEPVSAPVVDTSQFRDPPTPLAPREPKSKHASLQLHESKSKLSKKPEDFKKTFTKPQGKDKDMPPTESKVKRPSKPRMKTYKKAPLEEKTLVTRETKGTKPASKAVREDKVPVTEGLGKREISPRPEESKPEEVRSAGDNSPWQIDEFLQTDSEMAIEDLRHEASGDYALKYKAGVAARFPNPKRMSEYQREFEWKQGIKMSPLLDAEQVIYNSNVNASPIKPDIVPKVTEYRSQFKPFKTIPVPEEVGPVGQDSQRDPVPKKSKVKRSKSTGAIDRHDREDKSAEYLSDHSQDATLQEAKDKLKSAHGKYRKRTKSEYAMNFQPPWRYEYAKGAWKGANPPHIHQVATEEPETDLVDDAPQKSNWFAEVLELRQKATEYRRRAQGTHFSREHLVQLMAQQAELWDQLSMSSDALSGLSLEVMASNTATDRPRSNEGDEELEELDLENYGEHRSSSPRREELLQEIKKRAGKPRPDKRGKPSKPRKKGSAEDNRRKQAWSKEDGSSTETSTRPRFVKDYRGLDELDLEKEKEARKTTDSKQEEVLREIKKRAGRSRSAKHGKPNKPRKKGSAEERIEAWSMEDSPHTESMREAREILAENDEESVEGRIPTPTLRQQAGSKTFHRHHLDRTTPTVGGAILSSPPSQRKVMSAHPPLGSGYQSHEESDSDTLVDEAIHRPLPVFPNDPSPIKKTFEFRKIDASPTFGMPTRDAHFLRDDSASEDQPLDTHYVGSPLKPCYNHADEGEERIVKSKQRPRPSFIPPTLNEGMGMTYNKPQALDLNRQQKPFAWSLDGGNFVPRRTYDDDDDDVLSTSARSIASSSSLASEVLERAQRRQQEFWGRRDGPSR